MIRNAITTASTVATTGSSARASACSPRAPIPRLVRVTPSCMAAMNRGGSATIRWTARARLLPASPSSWILVRRAVTRAYSPATKKAFSKISAATPRSSRERVTFRPPPAWDSVGRRPRASLSVAVAPAGISERVFVYLRGARRVPRGALQERPEPREGDDVRLVAQPVHGLRAPLHLLLRPGVRASRGPALRRPLRPIDQGQGQCRRGLAAGALARLLAARDDRDRRSHRPLSAGRGALPAHARVPRGLG